MKITFLGTGSLEGIPSPYCKCQVCESAREKNSKDFRTRNSIFVEFNEQQNLLIDATPDLKNQLEMIKNKPFRNIFITHAHFDHYFGLGELSYLQPLYDIQPVIHVKKDVANQIKNVFGFCKLTICEVENEFSIDGKKINIIEVFHAKNSTTSGLIIDNVVIIPEIRKINNLEIEKLQKQQIELLIIDGAYYTEAVFDDHLTIQEAQEFGTKIKAKKSL